MGKSYSFKKEERLYKKKLIAQLFEEGKLISIKGFRLLYLLTELDTDYPAQLCVSVPKKKVPKAVNRNRMKRLMREAYRLNKSSHYKVLKELDKQAAIILIFSGSELMNYEEMQDKIILILERFVKELKGS